MNYFIVNYIRDNIKWKYYAIIKKNKTAIKILKSMKLRIGKVINSNDPVEVKHF